MPYQVSKQYAQCTHCQGRRFDIGPFDTFSRAREECQEWIDLDHERARLDASQGKKAPRGAGRKYAIDDGDATYWIEKVQEEDRRMGYED